MNEENFPLVSAPESNVFLQQAKERIAGYAKKSKAENTWRAYQSDFEDFKHWCLEHGLSFLPATPDGVAAYLVYLAPIRKVATVQRRVAAISQAHTASGHETPTASAVVRLTMQGIRREHAPQQTVHKVRPAVTGILSKVVELLTGSLIDVRDRVLLLIGFAGAFRRSELAELRFADISETEDGLRIVLRKSKTDQKGEGFVKGIPYGNDEKTCPVRAWKAWVALSGITDGQAFRSVNRHSRMGNSLSDQAIADMIKKRVAAAGFDPADFSGHSLRSGLITAAARNRVPERDIMRQSGHKHLPTVRGYIHEGSLFTDNAAAKVGL